jgi:hypothetical protein
MSLPCVRGRAVQHVVVIAAVFVLLSSLWRRLSSSEVRTLSKGESRVLRSQSERPLSSREVTVAPWSCSLTTAVRIARSSTRKWCAPVSALVSLLGISSAAAIQSLPRRPLQLSARGGKVHSMPSATPFLRGGTPLVSYPGRRSALWLAFRDQTGSPSVSTIVRQSPQLRQIRGSPSN